MDVGEGGRRGVSHTVEVGTEGGGDGGRIGCVTMGLRGDVTDLSCCSVISGMVVRRAMESVLPNPFFPLLVAVSSFVVTVIFGCRMGAKISWPMCCPREIVIGFGERLCIMAWISPR